MATGLDELIDFLLSEIALCGVQGASSADFHRFVREFYDKPQTQQTTVSSDEPATSKELGREFYETIWSWVSNHPDVRIFGNNQVYQLSLSEFEASESSSAVVAKTQSTTDNAPVAESPSTQNIHPASYLLSLRGSLQQRLNLEEPKEFPAKPVPRQSPLLEISNDKNGLKTSAITSLFSVQRQPRRYTKRFDVSDAVFDEPSTATAAPRLFASQNRIWQALTGHSIDLKKVPSMEFALLSLIAARGVSGITQPELTQLSNQDKRSVPHRTDELARKGYIVKNPVQSGKLRTSMCVHTKFVSRDHFLTSGAVDDVFQEGTFVVSGFAQLLYNKLKDDGIVPTREIRMKLNVPMRTWNKRAVQGALIRLDQSGMIKRFRVRKKKDEDSWAMCIKVLREPRPEDVDNLGFRRQAALTDVADELADEDGTNDSLMKDLDDMLDEEEDDVPNDSLEEGGRIPPQWTPDRLLANFIYEFTRLGGAAGCDGTEMRDRIVGPFWRRPMESYLSRLTDDWGKMQPPQLRHLAIVRDTRTSEEKKFIHYVYRTYTYFQEAVAAGEANWEGVSRPDGKQKSSKKRSGDNIILDPWGFRSLDKSEFMRFNGTATLSDVCSAIVTRKYGPRWDTALAEEIGHQKIETLGTQSKARTGYKKGVNRPSLQEALLQAKGIHASSTNPLHKNTDQSISLTPEERKSLGLKPNGRLTKSATKQILNHRRMTGDPTSLPDTIIDEPALGGRPPLMTKEERIAANLPARGRLGLDVENMIREQRGLPKLTEKSKKQKKSTQREAPILTKQQRISLGLSEHGRLHQHFVDALRQEREDGIPLEASPAVKTYKAYLGLEEGQTPRGRSPEPQKPTIDETLFPDDLSSSPNDDIAQTNLSDQSTVMVETQASTRPGKRRTPDTDTGTDGRAMKRTRGDLNVTEGSDTPRTGIDAESTATSLAKRPEQAPGAPLEEPASQIVENEVTSSADKQDLIEIARHEQIQTDLLPPKAKTEFVEDAVRTLPGLYIYPATKRKVGRGRPRNAFILVFKLDGLDQLPDWNVRLPKTKGISQALQPSASKPNSAANQRHVEADASANEAHPSPLPLLDPQSQAGARAAIPTVSALEIIHNNERRHQQIPNDDAMPEGHDEHEQQASSTHVVETDRQEQSTLPAEVPTLRKVAGWTAANAPDSTSYQSPYASQREGSSAPAKERAVVEGLSSTLDAQPTPSLGEPNEDRNLPQGVVGAIAEVEQNETPLKSQPKTIGPGIIGSAIKFRREIILEVIERCGGVFPLHGEIYRPFSALWDMRHGHTTIKKPISSTVFDSLRNMISNPAYGLKRMSFLVKARNAVGAKERSMVTKADMAPNDPKVVRLAYNMANFSLDKSHQYYPEEIRGLFDYTTLYVPVRNVPKDETVVLDQLYPPKLEGQIKEDKARRRREKAEQKRREKQAAALQNQEVEEVVLRNSAKAGNGLRIKRTRLASLNDKNKRYRRALAQVPVPNELDPGSMRSAGRDPSPAMSDSSEEVALSSMHPKVDRIVDRGAEEEEAFTSDMKDVEGATVVTGDDLLSPRRQWTPDSVSFTHPIILFNTSTGTFSTSFSTTTQTDRSSRHVTGSKRQRKRVRIDDTTTERPSKKSRTQGTPIQKSLDFEFAQNVVEDSDSTTSEDEEEENQKQTKRRVAGKRQARRPFPIPTLLERLTGLTGNPDDPVYKDPKQRQRQGYARSGGDRKKKPPIKRRQTAKEYNENFDSFDNFKQMSCALVLASSMSGQEGVVDWSIVEKVYTRDNFFDLAKTKRLWSWLQANMATQLAGLTKNFESNFLDAYSNGRLPAIEDPESYDWAGVVRWIMRTCVYPELPLPLRCDALRQFMVDESNYETLDRSNWYGKKIADSVRIQMQLRHSFVAPLHGPRSPGWSADDTVLKARSWIRANTATLEPVYEANKAHQKLETLGENILVKVVGDFVTREHLKMRKIKRQLPGRNYTFTKKLAKKYRRPFELGDFMAAAKVKKTMDIAFAAADPENRFYTIARSEEDGAIMAIMSMVSDGKVTLVPKLPSVNNDFGAPLPRMSKWGFCEGDYIHRAIDRNRLFWDIHIVPTTDYQFGNPLQHTSLSMVPNAQHGDWLPLPDPPLPGKNDSNALLPVWSSIDGQTVTWPWWYRSLNLVLQPLFLQPGATAAEIHVHCSENTIEVFEIELILDWLREVGAVTEVSGCGYKTTSNFWAAFGDKLVDSENDWFGEHIKRRNKTTAKQQWRDKYNLRFSTMHTKESQRENANIREAEQSHDRMDDIVSQQIFQNSRAQYGILRQSITEQFSSSHAQNGRKEGMYQIPAAGAAAVIPPGAPTSAPQSTNPSNQADVEMVDSDIGTGTAGEDVDAEGEDDDDMF